MSESRLTNKPTGPNYVSPWGQPGKKSMSDNLVSELNYYNIPTMGSVSSAEFEMVSEILLMPQLAHANSIIFAAALFIYKSKGKFTNIIPAEIVDLVIGRIGVSEKRDQIKEGEEDKSDKISKVNRQNLIVGIKANIIRFIHAIDSYLNRPHETMTKEDLEELDDDDKIYMDPESDYDSDDQFDDL